MKTKFLCRLYNCTNLVTQDHKNNVSSEAKHTACVGSVVMFSERFVVREKATVVSVSRGGHGQGAHGRHGGGAGGSVGGVAAEAAQLVTALEADRLSEVGGVAVGGLTRGGGRAGLQQQGELTFRGAGRRHPQGVARPGLGVAGPLAPGHHRLQSGT